MTNALQIVGRTKCHNESMKNWNFKLKRESIRREPVIYVGFPKVKLLNPPDGKTLVYIVRNDKKIPMGIIKPKPMK